MSAERPAHRGDGPCMDCGGDNIVWFTDNVFWNRVIGGPGTLDDPGGLLCIGCFVERADQVFRTTGWKLIPEWPWQYRQESS